ncbi:HEPN domain-containing protein [Puia sp. P3]|uniref:HEPN domain-containing protein n=1 Tax=Puia sp. P3 TaxID=3423952 RepID=UPI003D6708B3
MNTSIKHLSPALRDQLNAAIRIIVDAIHPEKIILFGVYSVEGDAELFSHALSPGQLPFDLLIATARGERRADYELQDILENRCRGVASVTTVVHDIDHINRQLVARQYFFSLVAMNGILLYDAGITRLEKPGLPDFDAVRKTAERDFERWAGQANAFYNNARFSLQNKEWKITTFLLHQAAEQIYQAILLVFTGYKPTTHNLDKLRRYTNRLSLELATLFPRDNPEEEHLFRLLTQGYVDARYKDHFIISEQEAGLLTERVQQLLDIAKRVCGNHLLSLGKKARCMSF